MLVHAQTIGQGLEALAESHFDAVLLDLGLSDASGVQGLCRIREAAQGVPVVVLSGMVTHREAVEAIREGAADVLSKAEAAPGDVLRALRLAVVRALRLDAV